MPLAVKRAGKDKLEAFREERARVITVARRPSEIVVTASSLSHEPTSQAGATGAPAAYEPTVALLPFAASTAFASPLDEVHIERVERVAGRPHGNRFGELVHHLLATARLAAEPGVVAEAAVRGRALGLMPSDVEAAIAAAHNALAHPILLAAAQAEERGECRRECAVTHVLEDGRVLEGVIDLAYRQNGAWVIVDFKTDVTLGDERRIAYGRQVAAYAAAVSQATGEPTRALLLMV